MDEHTSHCHIDTYARAGGAADGVGVGRPGRLLSLSGFSAHAAAPGLVQVTLAYKPAETIAGTFAVVGRLRWGTGKGFAAAEIDVPAGGAVCTVAGADCLEVTAIAEGTDTDVRVRVEAQISWVRASNPRPAMRTTFVPAIATTAPLPMPRFSRGVTLVSPAASGVTLVQLASHASTAALASSVGAAHTVVGGANAFRLLLSPAALAAAGDSIAAVWELSL